MWSNWERKGSVAGRAQYGVWSGGVFFAMADAAAVRG
jgi:Protein of unknown function (DUF1285).